MPSTMVTCFVGRDETTHFDSDIAKWGAGRIVDTPSNLYGCQQV
ncbi:MAG TPA: hypothetical protein VGC88_11250 [Terriglobales bacterium]